MAKKKKKLTLKNIYLKYRKILLPAFIALIGSIFIVILIAAISGINGTLSDIIREISTTRSDIDVINQSLLLSITNLNEMRQHMGLSEKTYPIHEKLYSEEQNEEEARENLAFFMAIEKIYALYSREIYMENFTRLQNDETFASFIKSHSFQKEIVEPYTIQLIKNNTMHFSIDYLPEEDAVTITTLSGKTLEHIQIDRGIPASLERLLPSLDVHLSQLTRGLTRLHTITKDPAIAEALQKKGISLTSIDDDRDRYRYVVTKNKRELGIVGLYKSDISFFINEHIYDMYEDFYSNLLTFIVELDTRDEGEKMLATAKESLHTIVTDRAFLTLLESKGLHIDSHTRSDDYFLYYDVLNEEGNRIGSFAIDLKRYDIYIVDKDEIQIGSLKSLMESENNEVKKK